ncbi:uncharacterized protein UHOD_12397 [Ustilago sp. UG-2017b]|nr:uncharacterized protein UHOD_12397 [Ustilago sp. UG-2017b]
MKCFTLLLQVLALTVAWLSSCLIVGSEMPVAKLIENIYTQTFGNHIPEAIIDKDYGRTKYLKLVEFIQRGPYKFGGDKFKVEQQLQMKRRVALMLVEQFAERMHQQKLQIQAEQARKAQEEVEKERNNWGKWLTLGRDGGEGSSSGSRRRPRRK